MAVQAGQISTQLTADVGNFVSGMRSAQRSFSSTVSTIQSGSATITRSAQQATNSLQTIASGVSGLQRTIQRSMNAIGAAFILPSLFSKAKSAIIDFNQTVDQSTIALEHFTGSKEGAQKLLGTLQDFAARTPFNFQDLLGTTQQMMAMGVAADDLLPRLTAIGDAAAALGGSPEVMQRIQRALGQIQAKGRVQAEELMQLAEAGIPAYEYIATLTGGDIPRALDKMKKGEIDAMTATTAILDGLSRDFKGMMESQSQTMMGAMSTVQDFVQMTVAALGRPIFDALRNTMLKVANFLSSKEMQQGAQRLAKNLANGLKQVGDVVGKLITTIGPILKSVLGNVYDFARAIGNGMAAAKPAILAVAAAFMGVLGAVGLLSSALSPILKLFADNKSLAQALVVVLGVLAARQMLVGTSTEGVAKAGTAFATSLRNSIANIRDTIAYQRALAAQQGLTITTMQALQAATVTGFAAMRAAVKAFMVEILPMLALMAAIYLVVKAFEAWGAKQRVTDARTKELTQSIKTQTDALLENADALKEGANGSDILSDAIFKTGEESDKLVAAFGALGKSANLTEFTSAADNFKEYAKQVLIAKGLTEAQATEMANLVDQTDDNDFKFLAGDMQVYAKSLEVIQDNIENIDFDKLATSQAQQMIGAGQVTDKMLVEAQAMTDAQVAALGLGDAAAAAAFSQNLLQIATDASRQKMVIAEQTAGEFQARLDALAISQQAAEYANKSAVQVLRQMRDATKDGEVAFEDFASAVLGSKYATMQFERSMRSFKSAMSDMFDEIAFGKGTYEDLKFAGYDLTDTILGMIQAADDLGMSQSEVTSSAQQMVGEFVAAAKQAGFTDSQIQNLVQSLGILNRIDPTITIYTDLSAAQADLKKFLEAYGRIAAIGTGSNSSLTPLLNQIAAAQAAVDSLSKRRAPSGGGGGGTKADPFAWVEGWVADLTNLTASLFDKNFAKNLMASTPEEIAAALDDVINEGFRLGLQNLEGGQGILEYIKGVSVQLQGMSAELARQTKLYDEAAQKVEDYTNALQDLKSGYALWMHEQSGELTLEEQLGNAISMTDELKSNVAKLRSEYHDFQNSMSENGGLSQIDIEKNRMNDLKKSLDDLRRSRESYAASTAESIRKTPYRVGSLAQAKRMLTNVRQFMGTISALRDRGFPPSVVSDVIAAGVDAGNRMGRSLLSMSEGDVAELRQVQSEINAIATQTGEIAAGVLFDADISEAERAFNRQRGILEIMFQDAIGEAEAALARQRQATESLWLVLISQAERNLADAKASEDILRTSIDDLNATMLRAITDIANAINRVTTPVGGGYTPPPAESIAPAPVTISPPSAVPQPVTTPAPSPTPAPAPVAEVPAVPVLGDDFNRWFLDEIAKLRPGQLTNWNDGPLPNGGAIVKGYYIPPGIRFMAAGGLVTKPTMAMIGEAGPEAVIPLSKMGSVAGGMGSGTTIENITINMPPGSDGNDVVRALKRWVDKNGPVPITTTATRRG